MNEKYSLQHLAGRDFRAVDPAEFNDTEIFGTAFAQKDPFTECFPAEMKNVTFTNCNLNNCVIPPTNIVNGGTHKQIKEQADGEMWIVDASLNPISPLKPYRFDAVGLSKDPAMIATQAATRIPLSTKEGASTKLVSVTMVKELKEAQAMKELLADTDKLRAILIAEGKI